MNFPTRILAFLLMVEMAIITSSGCCPKPDSYRVTIYLNEMDVRVFTNVAWSDYHLCDHGVEIHRDGKTIVEARGDVIVELEK